jgi:hypothetical protein
MMFFDPDKSHMVSLGITRPLNAKLKFHREPQK